MKVVNTNKGIFHNNLAEETLANVEFEKIKIESIVNVKFKIE